MTILRRSPFVHLLPMNDGSVLAIHAISQTRLTLTAEMARLIDHFDQPQTLAEAMPRLTTQFDTDEPTLCTCLTMLLDRRILTSQTAAAEQAAFADTLKGRDPAAALDRFRRANFEGSHPYWAVEAPQGLDDAGSLRHRMDVLLFGDCDVQMETDFLRREAKRRGIDLRPAASFAHDLDLARERQHDAIIIGALQARHSIALGEPHHHDGDPALTYVEAVRSMLVRLRTITAAPILIDGLPEPTLQPLGFADHGRHSHRNRFRRTNLALEDLAERFTDVRIVDVAAALGAAGSAALLDDGLVGFTHFGAPGWMLQRPASERAAVHDQVPDMASLTHSVGGDPYQREAVIARAHMDALVSLLGRDQKKCVIVDLDGVLWPGVLAETGSPFAWSPEISSPNSYIGLYFGIHEALLALRRRGILLACVSKNDEATVRDLWHYPDHYPRQRLLTPDSFVTWRVNWQDKAANIQSIADELGFAPSAFLFIDDNARERERVRHALPEITLLGEDLFTLRRALLTDPRLQPARLTAESAQRTDLVRAQLDRTRLRTEMADEAAFLASLDVVGTVDRLQPSSDALDRVRELFERTAQFNATGRKFTLLELQRLVADPDGQVYALRMRDRLADHGLVGAAVVLDGMIMNVAISCRVIGLGGERILLDHMIADTGGAALRGRVIATDRNLPARNLYATSGFIAQDGGLWIHAGTLQVEQDGHGRTCSGHPRGDATHTMPN
jgi:FkbH-like protein